jgi:hypothetical protein
MEEGMEVDGGRGDTVHLLYDKAIWKDTKFKQGTKENKMEAVTIQ